MTARRLRHTTVAAVVATLVLTGCDIAGPFRVLDEEREVERVEIAPDTISGALRDTVQLRARALGRQGREITEAEIVWSSGDPSVARAIGDGRFVVLSVGTAEVFATARGRRGFARVTGR